MIDVLVTGAAGKMGALSAQTIAAQDDLHLVALVDPKGADAVGDAPCFTGVEQALALTSPQAALEFSVPAAVFDNTRRLLEAGVPTVVGTTGLLDDQVGVLSEAAEAADLFCVAPATANILAKAACGLADDLLSTTLLAFAGPIIMAPAMNDKMWEKPAVRRNVAQLRADGVILIDPEEGYIDEIEWDQRRRADALIDQAIRALGAS